MGLGPRVRDLVPIGRQTKNEPRLSARPGRACRVSQYAILLDVQLSYLRFVVWRRSGSFEAVERAGGATWLRFTTA